MSIQPTDEFLVNRGGDSYSVQSQNLMSIQDTDLLLVNRSNKSYKVTGAEVKQELGGGTDISGNVSGGTLYQVRGGVQADADVRIFDTDDDLVVSGSNDLLMTFYIIAGGGGGARQGGGGGAGGVIEMSLSVPPGTHQMTIGEGGLGGGASGNTLVYFGMDGTNTTATIGGTTYTAIGGGGGGGFRDNGAFDYIGRDGGSGGGSGDGKAGGLGTPGQGFNGGKGADRNTSPSGGGGGYSSQGDDNAKFSASFYRSGSGGGGGAINWGLPDSVLGTSNGLTRFASGGAGLVSSSYGVYHHGGVPGSYGSGGNASSQPISGVAGAPGAVLVRYFILQ